MRLEGFSLPPAEVGPGGDITSPTLCLQVYDVCSGTLKTVHLLKCDKTPDGYFLAHH